MANLTQPKPFNSNPQRTKLPKLPSNATVSKRPLHRPAIPSPYAGAQQQKVVYVSVKTPFISAVKRVEKLLNLSDKRLVQSATTLVKQNGQKNYNKRKRGDGDEILEIATEIERAKGKRRNTGASGRTAEGEEAGVGEEVVLKATGKAIAKVLEMALWFQQREQYSVRLTTGSVGAIDDIEVNEEAPATDGAMQEADSTQAVDGSTNAASEAKPTPTPLDHEALAKDGVPSTVEAIPESRIRFVSCLEVAVSLR